MNRKPLIKKAYGSIGHLPFSKLGTGDHKINEGQTRICCLKKRDEFDTILVQEKLDGSCCSIAKINGNIYALSRAGYIASTSPYKQHHLFEKWALRQKDRFDFLEEGERIVGEWLAQAHGTIYNLTHEPYVVFDIFNKENQRYVYDEMMEKLKNGNFITPYLLHRGDSVSVENVLNKLGKYGFHGAIDPVEGAVWRVERKNKVDFLAKYVRSDKENGKYLPEMNNNIKEPIWNWSPPF